MSAMGIRRGDRVLVLERGMSSRVLVQDGLVMRLSMDPERAGQRGEPAVSVVSIVPEREVCGVDVDMRVNVVHFTHRDWTDGRVDVAYEELPNPVPGVCQYCRCTDRRACSPPCAWHDPFRTVCTAAKCVARHVDTLRRGGWRS